MPGEHKKERRLERDRQTTPLYAGIGRFIAEFEHVIFATRSAIIFLILGGRTDQNLVNALLAGLGAEQLTSAFFSMIHEAKDLNPVETRIVRAIAKRTKALIEKRNELVHSTWFIGWAAHEEEDVSTAVGVRIRRTKRGVEHRSLGLTTKALQAACDEAQEIRTLVSVLGDCLVHGFEIEKNLAIDGRRVGRKTTKKRVV